MQASHSLLQQLVDASVRVYPSLTGLRLAVTIRSLASFFYALGWVWVLLTSFTGWGRLIAKICRVQSLPASVACAVGIATTIFLGGLLNLLNAIYATVLFILVAIGLLFYFLLRKQVPTNYQWKTFWKQSSLIPRLLLITTLLILVFRVAGTVRIGVMNGLDDGPGYLTFPHKMLQVHSFAPDPFSERRVTTSLGAGYFIQAFIVATTSLANAAMADRALGLILFGGMLFDLGILFELSIFQIAWLEFLSYLVPQEAMNLTFVILPIWILLGMIWMVWRSLEKIDFESSTRYALLAGVLGGAAISMKSTYLPYVGTLALIPYVFLISRKRTKLVFRLPILAGLGTLAVLFTWMIAMKMTSGTWLYPVLGHGVDYSSYGLFQSAKKFPSTRRFVKIFLQGIALLVLAGIQLFAGRRRVVTKTPTQNFLEIRDWFSIAILVSAAIAITAVNYASGGDSIWRYNFPQFFSAVLVYYIIAASMMRAHPVSRTDRAAFFIGSISLIAMMFYYDAAGKKPLPFREFGMAWGDYKPSLRASLSGQHLENPQIQAEYRAVENSMPAHTVALENTAYPFLFNYHRRSILIADWAGAASPVPGWPFQSDSEALAQYLRSNSVRYIVYDDRYARWMDVEGCEALEGHDLNSEWLKEQWWLSILSHSQFDRLQARYHSIYNDGNIVVIDLSHPIANAPVGLRSWTLATNKDEICSVVLARSLADPLPALAQ